MSSNYCGRYNTFVKEEKQLNALRHYVITGRRTASVPGLFNSRPESVLLLARWTGSSNNVDIPKEILNNINWSKQEYLKQLRTKNRRSTYTESLIAHFTTLLKKMEDGKELKTDELVEIGYTALDLTILHRFDNLQQIVILPEFTIRVYEKEMYNEVNFKPESFSNFYKLVRDACVDHLVSMKHTNVTLKNLKKKPEPNCSSVQIVSALLKYNRLGNPYDNYENQMLHDVLGGTANKSLIYVKRSLASDKIKAYCAMYLKVYNQDKKQRLKPKKYDWGSLEIAKSFSYCTQCFGFDHDLLHCDAEFEAPPAYDHALAQDTKEKADSESEPDEMRGKIEKWRLRLLRK